MGGRRKLFTLKVTADELVLIERALPLLPVRNDAISLLLQQVQNLRPLPITPPTPSSSVHRAGATLAPSCKVQNLRPLPDITPPTPSSIRRAGASLSPSSTRFSTPETQAHMTLASPGSPLPFVGDQTLPAEGNLRDQAQMTSVTDQQWEMPTSFGLGSVDPETNDEM